MTHPAFASLHCQNADCRSRNPKRTSNLLEDMSPSAISTLITPPTDNFVESYFENPKGSYEAERNGANQHDPKQLIGQALKDRVNSIDHDACEPGDEDAFFVADLGEVYRQHMRWKTNLPRVKPFYGKSNCPICFIYAHCLSYQMQP